MASDICFYRWHKKQDHLQSVPKKPLHFIFTINQEVIMQKEKTIAENETGILQFNIYHLLKT